MPQVTVACKLPHGLVLRVFKMVDKDQHANGATRTVQEAEELPGRHVLNGFSHPQNKAPTCLIVEGAAITSGVDKDLWDLWLTQNKDSDMVKAGLIYAFEKPAEAEARARARKDTRSGLERMDPAKLPNARVKTEKQAA